MSAFDDILNEDEGEVTDPAPETVETPSPESGDEPAAVAESPTPEPTETSDPALVAEEAQPITRDDGAQWSEKAQRWYKDGKIVAGEKPDAVAAPSEPSIPSVAAAPEPVAEAPKAPSYTGDAFEFRGAGRKHAIPGAIVDKDGWTHIPPESSAQHRALLAAAAEHNLNWPRERQTFQQQVKEAQAVGEASAKRYNDAAIMLWDHVTDPEWLAAAAQNPERIALLGEKLGIALERAKLAIPQQPQAADEPSPEQIRQEFATGLDAATDEVLEMVPRGLFTPDQSAEIKADVLRHMRTYAAEHPETGELVIDMKELRADIQRHVAKATKARDAANAAREQEEKKRKAAAFNAANQPKVTPSTPKAPTPKPVPVTVPSGEKRGWDQSFKRAWSDDDDDK